jgi:hypothetical protein
MSLSYISIHDMSRHKTAIWETRSRERLLCTTLHDQSSSPCTSHTFPVKKTDTTCVTSTVHSYYLNLPVTILPSTTHFTKREQLGKKIKESGDDKNRRAMRSITHRNTRHGTPNVPIFSRRCRSCCRFTLHAAMDGPMFASSIVLSRDRQTATDAWNQITLSFSFVPSACRRTQTQGINNGPLAWSSSTALAPSD